MKNSFVFLYLILFLSSGCTGRKELGSKENPIKIALTPGKDVASLMLSGTKIKNYLEADLGLSFDVLVPPSYVAVIEAMGSKRSDIAILNTMGYLIAHEKYDAQVAFTLTNSGRSSYKGQIIARANGPKSLKDLDGKKIAFVDPISSSGHILPAHLLKSKHIIPKEIVFAGRHDNVVSMVYNKQVDAGATFWAPDENNEHWDARRLLLTQYPDVYEKIKVIAYTEYLPNEALTFRKEFPPELKKKIILSLTKWIQTENGKKTLKELYNCDGLKPATDKDYDIARKILLDLGKKIQDLSI